MALYYLKVQSLTFGLCIARMHTAAIQFQKKKKITLHIILRNCKVA
jgi:hypothetical protein